MLFAPTAKGDQVARNRRMTMAATGITYVRAKRQHTEYETDEFRATGG